MHKANNEKFEIENKIIKLALFGTKKDICEKIDMNIGGWIDNHNMVARTLLSHCAKRVLDIYRFPGYKEKYWLPDYEDKYKEVKKLFSYFSVEELEKAYNELEKLYEFTQAKLKEDFDYKNNKLKLGRSLSSFERNQIKQQLLNEKSTIEYRTNTITSYTTDGGLYGYGSPIFLEREVKVKNILIHSKYLKYHNRRCNYRDPEKEVWVVNRSPFGKVRFPNQNFKWDAKEFKNNRNLYKPYKDNQISIRKETIDAPESITMEQRSRPCESNFIKKMIRVEDFWNKLKDWVR
ncbi:hypothetical protein Halha_2169 [Halobacteroides halobius DSM 5150]|uniref:Uncharacterized protein n=1 Tax=Halobacteroides halobius (strain ATCC 35273 / DSM 5150 / MD-1) TaxID=748449 RepID=L0KAK9_HALHC|nr:NAD(+)--dinitrogen-reductase ADP-D-ribosyltransferase [Halobacteroides halobius]AGB42051.1 hypothetical protein Halha_2169 [Halobacteroides halobius DSM 5150]